MHATAHLLVRTTFPTIYRDRLATLQVNLGYRCNQSCVHCHVNAGPARTETMDSQTIALISRVIEARRIECVDLTGGAPELHPGFRGLVRDIRALGARIVDRCNLTVLFEPGQEDLAAFLADNEVEIVASLPCYAAANVDRQRGKGVFAKSISALRRLNVLGYGKPGTGLTLNLAYNPQGPVLPPDQRELQREYKRILGDRHGVVFDELLVITNMPIQRFGSMLVSKGLFEPYMQLLRDNYRAENLARVMCRQLISVDWQGYLHDCDFNQQLNLGMNAPDAPGGRLHLRDLLQAGPGRAPIKVAEHCYGCTAGKGSSCGGALQP